MRNNRGAIVELPVQNGHVFFLCEVPEHLISKTESKKKPRVARKSSLHARGSVLQNGGKEQDFEPHVTSPENSQLEDDSAVLLFQGSRVN